MLSLESADVVTQILDRPHYNRPPEVERSGIDMCVRGVTLSLDAGSARRALLGIAGLFAKVDLDNVTVF
jgi:hypothetical protein